MTSAQEFRQAFPPMVMYMWGPGGQQRRGIVRTRFNAQGTNGEEGEGRRAGVEVLRAY